MLSIEIWIHEGGGGGGEEKEKKIESDLGKGRRLQIPNIPGDEWENRSTLGKKTISRMKCKPYEFPPKCAYFVSVSK